jgi:hypothetical protein
MLTFHIDYNFILLYQIDKKIWLIDFITAFILIIIIWIELVFKEN